MCVMPTSKLPATAKPVFRLGASLAPYSKEREREIDAERERYKRREGGRE